MVILDNLWGAVSFKHNLQTKQKKVKKIYRKRAPKHEGESEKDGKTVTIQLSEGEVIWLCNRWHFLNDLSQTSFLVSTYIQCKEELFPCNQTWECATQTSGMCYSRMSCFTRLKYRHKPRPWENKTLTTYNEISQKCQYVE